MRDDSQRLLTLSSRERLLTAAMQLFAHQGFRQTTVGQIEQAAGFTARGGALYKHFTGKQAILEAAIERHVERISELRRTAVTLPLGNDEAELALLLQLFLSELDEERLITARPPSRGSR